MLTLRRSQLTGKRVLQTAVAQARDNGRVDIMRQVVVFDAADLAAESAFWAGMLGGRVFTDDRFHTVFDAEGIWRIGVQLAPDHTSPQWPDGTPQQIHLDLHVTDPDQVQAREEHW